MNIFYVYVLLNPFKPGKYSFGGCSTMSFLYEPFYVGKGVKRRMYQHILEAKRSDKHPKSKLIRDIINAGMDPQDYFVKCYEHITEDSAYLIEELLCVRIGLANKEQGPLLNLKRGGGGGLYGRYSKLSEEEELEIVSKYTSSTRSAHSIGKDYSVSKPTVLKILRKHGVTIEKYKQKHKLSHAYELYVCHKYKEGVRLLLLSAELDVPVRTLYDVLEREGVPRTQVVCRSTASS